MTNRCNAAIVLAAVVAAAGCATKLPPGVSVLSQADDAATLLPLGPLGRHDTFHLLYRGPCEKLPMFGTGIANTMAEPLPRGAPGEIKATRVKPLELLTIGYSCRVIDATFCQVAGTTMLQPGKTYVLKSECGWRCSITLHESETGAPVPLLPPLARHSGQTCVPGQAG